jgi:hypothetical protein
MMSVEKTVETWLEEFAYLSGQLETFESAQHGFVAHRTRRKMGAIRRSLLALGVPEHEIPLMPHWPNPINEIVAPIPTRDDT